MNLDKRQKILVGALAAVLLVWQGSGVFWAILFGPFDERSKQIAALDENLTKKLDAKHKLDLAERHMRTWERRSLPPNPVVASTLYHHWILDLAKTHNLERLAVTPKRIGTGTANPVFTRIPVTLTAECKMDQLCKFLYDFYRTDLMHKVTALAIESLDFKSNPTLKVNLELEGLSLASAKPRTTLFADKQDKAVSDAMAKKSPADYSLLTADNRFVRGYNGPPKPIDPPAPPAAPFDASPHVVLISSIVVYGEPPYAWLYDRTTNQQTVLHEGKDFEVAGVKGTVLEIQSRAIKLRVKDKDWTLELGKNLKEMVELKPAANAPSTASPAAESTPNATATPAAEPTATTTKSTL